MVRWCEGVYYQRRVYRIWRSSGVFSVDLVLSRRVVVVSRFISYLVWVIKGWAFREFWWFFCGVILF